MLMITPGHLPSHSCCRWIASWFRWSSISFSHSFHTLMWDGWLPGSWFLSILLILISIKYPGPRDFSTFPDPDPDHLPSHSLSRTGWMASWQIGATLRGLERTLPTPPTLQTLPLSSDSHKTFKADTVQYQQFLAFIHHWSLEVQSQQTKQGKLEKFAINLNAKTC